MRFLRMVQHSNFTQREVNVCQDVLCTSMTFATSSTLITFTCPIDAWGLHIPSEMSSTIIVWNLYDVIGCASLSSTGASIDSSRPRQNKRRHRTVEADPRRLRPHSNQCCQQQFTHSLVIRHKLQLYPTSSTIASEREASVALGFSAVHSFILFSLLLDSIALLSFTVSRVCFCSDFLVALECSSANIFVQQVTKWLLVSSSYILIQVAFSQRSLTCRPEAKQNKTQDDASSFSSPCSKAPRILEFVLR